MADEPGLARLARSLGDATRIRMLELLMEGRALTAKELAYGSGVQPATATAHLQRLVRDAVLAVQSQGRHKYFRLASPRMGELLELMMVLAPPSGPAAPPPGPVEPLRVARLCYDHLAGQLGTRLTGVLTARRLLTAPGRTSREYGVTRSGARWFEELGVQLQPLRASRRRFAFPCLDWSERRDHLAGALGAALAERLLSLGWLSRTRSSRALNITRAGQKGLVARFGLYFESGPER